LWRKLWLNGDDFLSCAPVIMVESKKVMANGYLAPDSRFLAHVFTSIFVAVISNPDPATAQRMIAI
jgi:hypothetical protein